MTNAVAPTNQLRRARFILRGDARTSPPTLSPLAKLATTDLPLITAGACLCLSHATTLVTTPGTRVWTSIIIARSVGAEEEETRFPKVFGPLLSVNPQL